MVQVRFRAGVYLVVISVCSSVEDVLGRRRRWFFVMCDGAIQCVLEQESV